ncbi:MAG: acyltransferase [Chthoniobacterales bacterium]
MANGIESTTGTRSAKGDRLQFIPALDGLRGIFAFLVVVSHYGYCQIGWVSINIFFCLSGYLLTSILITEKKRPLGEYLGRFYWRRLLRTFPAYFGFLFLCGILYLCLRQPAGFPGVLPPLATYWYNFKILLHPEANQYAFLHFWSLSVEEQFYLFWPLFVFALSAANMRRLVLAIIVLVPCLRVAIYFYARAHGLGDIHVALICYLGTPLQLDGFALGAAIAVFRLRERTFRLRWLGAALAVAFALGVINASFGADPYARLHGQGFGGRFFGSAGFGYPHFLLQNRQFLWGYTVANLLCAGLVLAVLHRNVWQRFCELSVLRYLGRISYGIYIVHWPLIVLLLPRFPSNPWSPAGLLWFAGLFAVVVLLAHLSYQYFERRFLLLKDYFAKRTAGLAAPVST